ncbi:nicotinate phosphoribosyltransferase [Candidatus Kuenenbacteria bacterium]|nr:nicotinate phosphoribosyltransferase [Candidatus Kuenenbacteria bacterium]
MKPPTNPLVRALLTDMYQITMVYGYWKAGKHNDDAVFDQFFRECPFGGEFAIFAGLGEALKYVNSFGFSDDDIEYIRGELPDCDPDFFKWLRQTNTDEITIHAIHEGSVVFPRTPPMIIYGPLGIGQMLETALLNLVNYPTLIATNAARFRLAAGPKKFLIDMGLRRAQGPDGALSGALYSYIGGFDATSNVLAGKLFGIPIKGTHAHSFVTSFASLDDIEHDEFVERVLFFREKIQKLFGLGKTNDGELAAFIAYARAFPKGFLALVDTYNTLKSGVPNFLAVAFALAEKGLKPVGIRLDSGDLAHLSKESRKMFITAIAEILIKNTLLLDGNDLLIAASNDINEGAIHAMNQQGHEIDTFGVGTHNITCQAQPAMGGVYKLVEINGRPCIKISENQIKILLPGKKTGHRLIGKDGRPILDLLIADGEPEPRPGERILCCHPFDQHKRVYVTPSAVRHLHICYYRNGVPTEEANKSIAEIREHAQRELASLREDHLRTTNPTPYKTALSESLFNYLHKLWSAEAPIDELS